MNAKLGRIVPRERALTSSLLFEIQIRASRVIASAATQSIASACVDGWIASLRSQ
ncbi:hypothetical protein [Bradyrhizobium cenepequi]